MRQRPRAIPVWEDPWFLALSKPEGLPVISPEGSRARSLYDVATDLIRRANPKGRAAVVHRIDRDTSGLVLFAKGAAGKKAMMDDWDSRVKERRYVAVVVGAPRESEGLMVDFLAENRAGEVRVVGPDFRGAKEARSAWRVLASDGSRSLVELALETGRKHQIRVQLASRGLPILGDPRYGRGIPACAADRLYLHARSLVFLHPFTGELIELDCPPPPSFERALSPGCSRGSAPRRPGPRRGRSPG